MTRASSRTRRTRPISRSIPCSKSSNPAAERPVRTSATALTNQGWSEAGTGAHDTSVNGAKPRDEARVIDLDLLIYRQTLSGPGETPVLPHPRLAERAFVVLPLAELAPDWRHPGSGRSLQEMIRALPADQRAEAIE